MSSAVWSRSRHRQLGRLERLGPQAQPGRAVAGEHGEPGVADVGRIRFDRQFAARRKRKAREHARQQPLELRRRELRRRAPAEVERVDRSGRIDGREFSLDRP